MRIGHGEFTTEEFKIDDARNLFLIAIQQESPEVLKALRDTVLPCYEMDDQGADRALVRWAASYNLDNDWFLEQASETIKIWLNCPAMTREPLTWCAFSGGSGHRLPESEEERRFVFENIGWSPSQELKEHARTRLRAEFEKYLGAYLERMEVLVTGRGFERTPEKRQRTTRDDPLLHFRWLVRHLVQKKSYREIADEYSVYDVLTEDTFYKAIHKTADMIGMILKMSAK
jgi:hypothetical protein